MRTSELSLDSLWRSLETQAAQIRCETRKTATTHVRNPKMKIESTRFTLGFLVECKMLQSTALDAKIGVDTADTL